MEEGVRKWASVAGQDETYGGVTPEADAIRVGEVWRGQGVDDME